MSLEEQVRQAGDTDEERAAFLKWWEGARNWSGSACAVAYQGWLAAKTDSDDQLRALGHVERQRDELAAENAALRDALCNARSLGSMPGDIAAHIDRLLDPTVHARCSGDRDALEAATIKAATDLLAQENSAGFLLTVPGTTSLIVCGEPETIARLVRPSQPGGTSPSPCSHITLESSERGTRCTKCGTLVGSLHDF